MAKTNKTDKVISLTRKTVAFENILEGQDLHQYLGKEISIYMDETHFFKATVEDIMPGSYRVCGIDYNGSRCQFMILKSGIGLSCPSKEAKTLSQHYKLWMAGAFGGEREEGFSTGLTITLSPKISKLAKEAIAATRKRTQAFKALFSKVADDLEEKTKNLTDTGAIRLVETEDNTVTITVDEKLLEIVFEVYEVSLDWVLQKAAGLIALADVSGIKSKMEALSERAKSRNEALK